jgi:hypothetical protein
VITDDRPVDSGSCAILPQGRGGGLGIPSGSKHAVGLDTSRKLPRAPLLMQSKYSKHLRQSVPWTGYAWRHMARDWHCVGWSLPRGDPGDSFLRSTRVAGRFTAIGCGVQRGSLAGAPRVQFRRTVEIGLSPSRGIHPRHRPRDSDGILVPMATSTS